MEQNLTLPEGFQFSDGIIYGLTKEGLFHIKLHNPKQKNPITIQLNAKLQELLRYANTEEKVKVVLVYGAEGSFSSGAKVLGVSKEEILAMPLEDRIKFMVSFTLSFALLEKPLYYFIQGCAVGLMATSVAHADFAYATEDAFFFTPFVSMNLGPEDLSSYTYPQIFGRKKASELLYLDQRMTAQEALKYGHLNAIMKKEDAPNTEPIITDISKLPNLQKLLKSDPKTLQYTKKMFIQGQDIDHMRKQVTSEFYRIESKKETPEFWQNIQKFAAAIKNKDQPKL
ncbi:enoyl-hydratase [Stylonychia lemnae]|uniref:Enoyl-hydratase n=1 Tax=Stylonychia lemnae TaxID=5949 RepID=A0A078B4H0_STYLE|nr:enoyl-hydratase [Stylonychia lemnae]|eukprot:CDW88117.1 enoyl-hydratase [Stylonychia lemnae]